MLFLKKKNNIDLLKCISTKMVLKITFSLLSLIFSMNPCIFSLNYACMLYKSAPILLFVH
jgi:hypothetical protein